MQDKEMLRELKSGSEAALEAAIDRYSGYVAAVIKNRAGAFASPEDVEELCADVFASLWRGRSELRTAHLRGWLGAAARNAASGFLRSRGAQELSDEDVVLISGDSAQRLAESRERTRIISRTLAGMKQPDREAFLRYYYYNQSVAEIAEVMKIPVSTVTTKLQRAREKLKQQLIKEGYTCEA